MSEQSLTPEEQAEILRQFELGILSLEQTCNALHVKSKSTVYRKLNKLLEGGIANLIHGNTGRSPVNRFPPELEERIKLLMAGRYQNLHPALAVKYLLKEQSIKVSEEYIRLLLNKFGTRAPAILHPLRRRRESFGELIQIDGSPHPWLGPEYPSFCLIVFVDDATSLITAAGFFEAETSLGYRSLIRQHIYSHGIPCAFYSDRFSALRVTGDNPDADFKTQYQRACEMIGIETIYALTAPAKGRVERLNQTLQGRWPKELQLKGVKSMEEANEVIHELIGDYNMEFERLPRNPKDAHLPVKPGSLPDIDRKCALWTPRRLSKNLTCSYRNNILQVTGVANRMHYMNKEVQIIEYDILDGRLEMWCEEKLLPFKQLTRNEPIVNQEAVTAKKIDYTLDPLVRIRRELQAKQEKEDKDKNS